MAYTMPNLPLDVKKFEANTGPNSMLPMGMFLPERLNAVTFNNLEAELIRIRDECGITFVLHFMRNTTATVAYVESYLDHCEAQGFKTTIGFEDRPVDNGSGAGDWDISDYVDFFAPNLGHNALYGIASIDEPYEVTSTARLRVLITQLKAALPDYPIYTNFSGGIRQYGDPTSNLYNPARIYDTGLGDIVGITNLPFNVASAPPLYGKSTLYQRVAFSRQMVREVHEAAGTPVPPVYTAIQAFGGDGATRLPDPPEMLDSLEFQLSPLLYSYGPMDRIIWQRWHQRTVGGSANVLRNSECARHRDYIKILSERL